MNTIIWIIGGVALGFTVSKMLEAYAESVQSVIYGTYLAWLVPFVPLIVFASFIFGVLWKGWDYDGQKHRRA